MRKLIGGFRAGEQRGWRWVGGLAPGLGVWAVLLLLLTGPAYANTTSACVPAGSTVLAGEVTGWSARGFFGNRSSSTVVTTDGSTWVRNPLYAAGASSSDPFAVAGFRFSDAPGHTCTNLTAVIGRLDGLGDSKAVINRPGGTFVQAGNSLGGGGADTFLAGTASCKIECDDSAAPCCSCICDKMSYTLL